MNINYSLRVDGSSLSGTYLTPTDGIYKEEGSSRQKEKKVSTPKTCGRVESWTRSRST